MKEVKSWYISTCGGGWRPGGQPTKTQLMTFGGGGAQLDVPFLVFLEKSSSSLLGKVCLLSTLGPDHKKWDMTFLWFLVLSSK